MSEMKYISTALSLISGDISGMASVQVASSTSQVALLAVSWGLVIGTLATAVILTKAYGEAEEFHHSSSPSVWMRVSNSMKP